MKKEMKKVMIVLGIILIGLTSCGKSGKKTIVGKWKEVGGTQIIEFFKDGTVTVTDKGEPPMAGDYMFIDGNRIRMDLKGLGELFGPVIAEISASRDEITLTAPGGKIEKYRRYKEREKITKSRIAGRYIMEEIVEGEVEKEQGIWDFKEDGTTIINLSGKWETEGNQIKFYEGDKETERGEITDDTIRCSGRTFTKQKRTKIIKKNKNITVWSEYSFFGGESGEIESSNLRLKKGGTFSEVLLMRYKWRIKNGNIQLYTNGEGEPLEGRIEGNTIVFGVGAGKLRFVRQN